MELRGYGYETIGLLAKAAPEKILFEPNLDLLGWLFRSLREDASGKDVAVSIEEALSSVLGVFSKPFDVSIRPKFRQMLLRYSASSPTATNDSSDKLTRSTRYVATRFANRCLPYEDVLARWIDILAVSGGAGERHEVVEEGKKGLDPYWFRMSNSMPASHTDQNDFSFPDFDDLVNFFFDRPDDDDDDDDINMDDDDAVARARRLQHRFPETIATVITFSSEVAIHAALNDKDIREQLSEDWGRKLETMITTDLRARQAFRAYTARNVHALSLATILRASFDRVTRDELSDIGDIGTNFVRLLSLCPDSVWTKAALLQQVRSLEPSILSNNASRRLAASHAFGLLASHPECDPELVKKSQMLFLDKIKTWKTAIGGDINSISGAITALSYYFSRLHWRKVTIVNDGHPVLQLLETVLEILRESKDTTLKSAVFLCIDQMSLFNVLTPAIIAKYAKFQDVVQQVYDSAKGGTTNAIIALGHLSMIIEEESESSESTDYSFILDKIYDLHEVRQSEVQFSVGEALSCFACGWESKALTTELDIEHPDQEHDPWDTAPLTPSGPKRERTLTAVLEKTLKGCRQTKPSLKKASVIWLLCLLQYCGQKPEMQQHLPQCQTAFKLCLSNRDEVVQEAASRGLGLVYEKGDRQLKDDLVRDLVGSFSDDKSKMAGTVTEDTELFEPGALPTGDGSVTTYKDILSLASEVGDSSLVYRFMSLASNNSIWSSRAAFGRFGLSNIFSDSSVDGYLAENPKLYPKLFRYRYVFYA
jgi:proteasome component ECM29